MEINQKIPLGGRLFKACDVPVEQEELDFLKAIEQGLIDAREKRTVSLRDVRKRLGLNPISHQSL
jgi:hypothetical protein